MATFYTRKQQRQGAERYKNITQALQRMRVVEGRSSLNVEAGTGVYVHRQCISRIFFTRSNLCPFHIVVLWHITHVVLSHSSCDVCAISAANIARFLPMWTAPECCNLLSTHNYNLRSDDNKLHIVIVCLLALLIDSEHTTTSKTWLYQAFMCLLFKRFSGLGIPSNTKSK